MIKQLFDILGIGYKSVPHTRIKNSLKYYNEWWDKVYGYIKDDINRIIFKEALLICWIGEELFPILFFKFCYKWAERDRLEATF